MHGEEQGWRPSLPEPASPGGAGVDPQTSVGRGALAGGGQWRERAVQGLPVLPCSWGALPSGSVAVLCWVLVTISASPRGSKSPRCSAVESGHQQGLGLTPGSGLSAPALRAHSEWSPACSPPVLRWPPGGNWTPELADWQAVDRHRGGLGTRSSVLDPKDRL